MGRIRSVQARWTALSRPRRLAAIATVAVAAGLAGAAAEAGSGHGTPAPVVWRDHVVDPTTSTTLPG
jgi:hypothetical protein